MTLKTLSECAAQEFLLLLIQRSKYMPSIGKTKLSLSPQAPPACRRVQQVIEPSNKAATSSIQSAGISFRRLLVLRIQK